MYRISYVLCSFKLVELKTELSTAKNSIIRMKFYVFSENLVNLSFVVAELAISVAELSQTAAKSAKTVAGLWFTVDELI